ncbi:MAG: hypothetical protein KIS78_04445 [Labilithrix sp.]|nr:hypothetical protein [Labilithrix sp.]
MRRLGRAVTLALVWSSRAAAEPEDQGLRVESADDCLTPESIVREIRRFRASRPDDGQLSVTLTAEGDGVVATIARGGDALGERRFDRPPRDCGERQRLVGIALAVALERLVSSSSRSPREVPDVEAPGSTEAPSPAVVPEAEPRAPASRPRAVELPRTDRPRSWSLTAAGYAAGSAGFFPTVGGGGGGAVGARVGRWSLDVGAEWQGGLTYALGPGDVDTSLLAGNAAGCAELGARSRTRLGACAGAMIGRWRAEGRGYGRDAQALQPWVAASLGLRAYYAVGAAVDLRLAVDGVLPLLRPTVEVRDGASSLEARTASAAIRVAVGPELRF